MTHCRSHIHVGLLVMHLCNVYISLFQVPHSGPKEPIYIHVRRCLKYLEPFKCGHMYFLSSHSLLSKLTDANDQIYMSSAVVEDLTTTLLKNNVYCICNHRHRMNEYIMYTCAYRPPPYSWKLELKTTHLLIITFKRQISHTNKWLSFSNYDQLCQTLKLSDVLSCHHSTSVPQRVQKHVSKRTYGLFALRR